MKSMKMVKRTQSEPAFYLGTSTNRHMISVNAMSSFILKYFLQNLKNSLVAKRTIGGGTLGRPVDSWVSFGNRGTIFQQHCSIKHAIAYNTMPCRFLHSGLAKFWTSAQNILFNGYDSNTQVIKSVCHIWHVWWWITYQGSFTNMV